MPSRGLGTCEPTDGPAPGVMSGDGLIGDELTGADSVAAGSLIGSSGSTATTRFSTIVWSLVSVAIEPIRARLVTPGSGADGNGEPGTWARAEALSDPPPIRRRLRRRMSASTARTRPRVRIRPAAPITTADRMIFMDF